jgi:hypothetical protein
MSPYESNLYIIKKTQLNLYTALGIISTMPNIRNRTYAYYDLITTRDLSIDEILIIINMMDTESCLYDEAKRILLKKRKEVQEAQTQMSREMKRLKL